ncbi:steroid receptor RNA activator 1-like [Ostrea edulis]|uniref:steroid receptor RNA activator 1-like n=1 Tax=Ostrea edulis TaxID=37623 RepID=UPI0024AF5CF1|nr:steroid receptor RNA activator 1-like [Ostrea edulis]
MAAPRPGNTERGWNDPPVFDYQSSSALQSSHKRTNLNRRVAYPLSNKDNADRDGAGTTLNPSEGPPLLMPVVTSSPVQLLPPVPTTCAPAPVPLLVPGMVVTPPAVSAVTSPISQGSKAGFSSLEEALKALNLQSPAELLDIITTSLQGSLDKVKSSITERSFDDVKKKIQLFRESWDNLPLLVKCRMCSMAEAMKKTDYDEAWSIHQNLMVDYTAEVNVWMVGIKKVIHELRNLPELSRTPGDGQESAEQSDSPVIQPDSGNCDTGISEVGSPENQDVVNCDTEKEDTSQTDVQTDNSTEGKSQSNIE